jgi:hypothetical protein
MVTVPTGYIAEEQTLTVAEMAEPSLSGNVVTIPVGYNKYQLKYSVGTAKAAETITPGTVDQTIPADTYLTGDLTIKGDANLISENIINGKTIFGVTGTHECIGSDGPVYDLSFVTAGEEDIREGKVGATTYGSPVYGTLKVDAVSSDVEYGYIDENGMFQKLDLSGDTPVNVGLPEDLNNAGFYNIPVDEADYTKEWKNPELYKYLTLTANEPNSTVNLMPKKSPEHGMSLPDKVFYRTNVDSDFKPYTLGTTINLVNVGDYVQFWNKKSLLSADYNFAYVNFYMTGSISARGNIQSLLNFQEHAAGNCFTRLFEDCTSLTTAPELPATTVGAGCYHDMFKGCTNLTAAPELPATILDYGCYGGMFEGCTSLKTAPKLPALELENSCYRGMFEGCTSLTTAPELPATEVKVGCYAYMFAGCTSLTAAPELPAANLVDTPAYGGCYEEMFNSCTSLKTIKVGFTAWDGDDQDGAVRMWLYNVAESGTFYKPSALPEEFGSSRIPEGWTVVNID